jgi:hypothetical protein
MKFDKEQLLIKLTSRKFLLTLAAVITMLANAFGADPDTSERIVSLFLAIATVVTFVLIEGTADVKKISVQFLELLKEFEIYEETEGDSDDSI